jgi:hypothetical protein
MKSDPALASPSRLASLSEPVLAQHHAAPRVKRRVFTITERPSWEAEFSGAAFSKRSYLAGNAPVFALAPVQIAALSS